MSPDPQPDPAEGSSAPSAARGDASSSASSHAHDSTSTTSTAPGADGVERYEPSGRVAAHAWLALPLGAGLAALLGWVYQRALDGNPLRLLNIFMPVVFGIAIASIAIAVVYAGKIRNATWVRLTAIGVTIVAFVAAWAESLDVTSDDFPGVFEVLGARLRAQAAIVFAWGFEAAIAIPIAILVPITSWWRRAVFSESDGRFVRRKLLGVGYGPTPLGLRQAVGERGIEAVHEAGLVPLPENEQTGEFRFYLHDARGDGVTFLTVLWRGGLENLRGRKVQREVLVLRRLLVDASFVERTQRYLRDPRRKVAS